jgi:dsDNA-binding SOS-regulon protein
MSVKTFYIVENRNGDVVLKTEDKKYATWYDKRMGGAYELQDFVKDNILEDKNLSKKEKSLLEERMDSIEDVFLFLSFHQNKTLKLLKGTKSSFDILDSDPFDEYC